jgi:hypothetical protein
MFWSSFIELQPCRCSPPDFWASHRLSWCCRLPPSSYVRHLWEVSSPVDQSSQALHARRSLPTSAMLMYLNKQGNYMGDSSRNHLREPYYFALLFYPFFSNYFSIPCFVLKHLQHLWLDLPPWCKHPWLLVCFKVKQARSYIYHLFIAMTRANYGWHASIVILLWNSSTVQLFCKIYVLSTCETFV